MPFTSVVNKALNKLRKSSRNTERLQLIAEKKPTTFKYADKLTECSVRVLELYPGKSGDIIKCRLTTISSQEADNTYEAISYAWGDSEDKVGIICNGDSLEITNSLAGALTAIRHATLTTLLWADAICINQSDEEEKGHQVKQMGKVYENAKRVIVWLGPDTAGIASETFEFIKVANQYFNDQLLEYGILESIPVFTALPHFLTNSETWADVVKFASLSWFSRLWVIQEAGLAKECILLWGASQIDFAEWVEMSLWMNYRPDLHANAGGEFCLVDAACIFQDVQCRYTNSIGWRKRLPLCTIIHDRATAKPTTFAFLLEAGGRMQASDKRDHVYGFLGNPLALMEEGRLLIEPDYTKSVRDVYLDTASAFLQNPPDAPWLLCCVDHHAAAEVTGSDETETWPSWLHRWNRRPWAYRIGRPEYWFCAGGFKRTFTASVLSEHGQLSLITTGVVFDHLSWLSPVFDAEDFNIDPHLWGDNLRSQGTPLVDNLLTSLSNASQQPADNIKKAFISVLCLGLPDRTDGMDTISSHIEEEFDVYCRFIRQATTSTSISNNQSSMTKTENPFLFWDRLHAVHHRRVALTRNGRVVLAPCFAEVDDSCCIFPGVAVPLILRSTGNHQHNLVGDCYIEGVMGGELMEKLEQGEYQEAPIALK
jgi:hypothetical protein